MWDLKGKKKNSYIKKIIFVIIRSKVGVAELKEMCQKVKTLNYKINKS